MTKVIILSVPYCEPYIMVAPALLSSCLSNKGIPTAGIDFNIKFVQEFSNEEWWPILKHSLALGGITSQKLPKSALKKVYKFTSKFLASIVDTYQPEMIGLSIFTSESLDFGLFMSYLIRKRWPNIQIIAGGKGLEVKHANQKLLAKIWADTGIADTVVVGDAETAIFDIVNSKKKGIVYAPEQSVTDLDLIPLPNWSLYNLDAYSAIANERVGTNPDTEPYLTVTSSKGCVLHCTFCDVASFWPDYLYRDPVKVANEIIHNYKSTGIKRFRFTDNLINGSISNYREMNKILAATVGSEIRYEGYAVFRNKLAMPLEDFKLAYQAGCRKWAIGIESGSEKVRQDIGKKFSNDDIDWSARALFNNNIQQSWLLIVGYPSETEEDFIETKNLLKRYSYMATNQLVEIGITPTFSLLSNSPLLNNSKLADRYGLTHNTTTGNDKFWTSSKYIDNDYPTRSRRWKELVATAESLGFKFQSSMPIEKWHKEIESLDTIYHESNRKIFPIHSAK